MPVIQLILSIALLGLIVWVVVSYVPMPTQFRTAIIAIALILVVIYLIGIIGIIDLPIPRVR